MPSGNRAVSRSMSVRQIISTRFYVRTPTSTDAQAFPCSSHSSTWQYRVSRWSQVSVPWPTFFLATTRLEPTSRERVCTRNDATLLSPATVSFTSVPGLARSTMPTTRLLCMRATISSMASVTDASMSTILCTYLAQVATSSPASSKSHARMAPSTTR